MDEMQKGASLVNRKEKNSFLDDDIGKDFLTSWKSMSVTKEDAMDFGFDTVSGGKNKAFNFEKLDIDFSLDGDFDKISSFKVDMSDFDLSSPSKKVAKLKEKSEDESSTGKPQEKKSQFNFFDFNEMDNFDCESSSFKAGKASIKNKDSEMDISSDGTERRSSKTQLRDDAGVFDDSISTKLPASDGVVTSGVETLLRDPGHLIAKEKDCEKSILARAPILPHSARSSPEKEGTNSAETIDKHSHLSGKEICMDNKYSQNSKFDFPGSSLVGVDSQRNALPDGQTQSSHQGTEVHTTPGQKEDTSAKITGVSSYNETSPLKNPSSPNTTSGSNNGTKNESGTDTPTETVDCNESTIGDLDLIENSFSSVSRKTSHDVKDNKGNQNFTAELPSALISSEPVEDKWTLINQNITRGLNLKCPKGEASEHVLCQAASLETKSHSSRSESMGSTYKTLGTETENGENSNEAQVGIRSGDSLLYVSRDLSEGEDAQLVGANSVKHLNNLRNRFNSDVLPNNCKLVGTSRLSGEGVIKIKHIMSTSDKTATNQNTIGLSEKQQAKSNSPTSANPKLLLSSMEAMRNAKIKSVEGNKLPLVRSPKKIPDISILKMSKISDSTSQRDTSFLQSPKHDVKVQYTAAIETAHPLKSTAKKSPPNRSLKRKAFELPNLNLPCLKPLKRLSSPQEIRDFQEPSRQVVEDKPSKAEKCLKPLNYVAKASGVRDVEEPLKRYDVKESFGRVEEEKICIHGIQKGDNAQGNLNSVGASAIESPQEVNVMELELSLTIENDGSFEKAEAYAKELENICNMLRKKHEEAKEILVRALVNNNNLLMLNHPIFEEKICKVRKFAAELMCKEIKT